MSRKAAGDLQEGRLGFPNRPYNDGRGEKKQGASGRQKKGKRLLNQAPVSVEREESEDAFLETL